MHEHTDHVGGPDRAAGEGAVTGTVFRKDRGLYHVRVGSEMVRCGISNRLRKQLFYPVSDPAGGTLRGVQKVKDIDFVDPIAIGDLVAFVPAEDGAGMIKDVLPRRSVLGRRIADAKRRMQNRQVEQVIAANVDQVVPVFAAANPKPRWHLLDRYLVTAERAGIPVLVCVTKMDIADRERTASDLEIYERIGYRVARTSAVTGEGVDSLREDLSGKTSVFLGKSGVGKTSLLNRLQPGLGLLVKEISGSTGKGRHATTHLEMFPLDGGGGVVDTPGMKVFPLLDEGEDLASYFPEMRPRLGSCRFGADCSHSHEPGCAIKDAVESGEIERRRYESLLKMRR